MDLEWNRSMNCMASTLEDNMQCFGVLNISLPGLVCRSHSNVHKLLRKRKATIYIYVMMRSFAENGGLHCQGANGKNSLQRLFVLQWPL